nr:MAG TPA: hypothetical protein [Herelleviridae sp.]
MQGWLIRSKRRYCRRIVYNIFYKIIKTFWYI